MWPSKEKQKKPARNWHALNAKICSKHKGGSMGDKRKEADRKACREKVKE